MLAGFNDAKVTLELVKLQGSTAEETQIFNSHPNQNDRKFD